MILPQRSYSLPLGSVAINCHKWNLKEIAEFGYMLFRAILFWMGCPGTGHISLMMFFNKHMRAFQVNGDLAMLILLDSPSREIKNPSGSLSAPFAFLPHFKSIPSILKYEVILISITTWTENADHFQCIYKIFTSWISSRDEKHQLTEMFWQQTYQVLGLRFTEEPYFAFGDIYHLKCKQFSKSEL